ncbi:MAG: CDP-alcohol phosphatidyltransferase family protein [Draconibacterium sp.]
MNKKHIPNILSVIRIFLSFLLLFLFKNQVVFILFYFAIGLTDILDGYLARKLKAETTLGARLDSIGDFVFHIILVIYLIIEYQHIVISFGIPVLLVIIIRLGNIIIGFVKYKRLIMIHTIANKVTGVFVFLLPFMLILELNVFFIITVCMALLSSIEETAIIFRSPKENINLNQKSFS